jgi:predicted O-linked N-acetylglucosamine transferase (SPINDLY family)
MHVSIADLLGTAQQFTHAGRPALAASLYRDWLTQNPDAPLRNAIFFNYGVVLSSIGDIAGAAAAFQEAIRSNPAFLPPYINLGSIQEQLGAPEQALTLWSHVTASLAGVTGEAIDYKVAALKQSALLLESRKRLAAAEDSLRQIIDLRQHQRDVIQHWISLRQRQCKWPLLHSVGGLGPRDLLRHMAPLTAASYADDPLLQLASAAAYCREDVGRPNRPIPEAPPVAWRGRLRIGYLSSDLRGHAIGYLMADMLRHHDRNAFEIFVYYCGIPQEDGIKQRICGQAEHWCSITELGDDAAFRRIRDDRIDILIDINGHTRSARTRLLAMRPAPAIVNWLGFAGSMGSAYHHYIIADSTIIPEDSELFYSEKVLRLPCYQPTDPHRLVADTTPTRGEAGLPDDAVVFCCFNGSQKITPFGFGRWMEILRQVPNSVLWLLKGAEEVDVQLRALATAEQIAPERLVFAPLLGNAEHLARYALADLFLDTAPYGAHTTASDALWMGVPVLALQGRCFASRVCASLVRAAGVPELICNSPKEYVARAVALGRDQPRLAAYRRQLLDSRSTSLLFDTPRLVREMEQLFRGIAADIAAGMVPIPDLTNLDTYLDIGACLDHESVEFSFLPEYAELYWRALTERHAFASLPRDQRLWRGSRAPDALPLSVAA